MTEQAKAITPITKTQNLLKTYESKLVKALPKHIDGNTMMRSLVTAVSKNPKLAACTPVSFLSACYEASQLGLPPDSTLGLGYLIPYGNKVTFVTGFKGLIQLAKRSGNVASIWAREVYPTEDFQINEGTKHEIHHVPNLELSGTKLTPTFVYAVIRYKDGTTDFDYMSYAEIEEIRKSSAGKNSDPWVKHWVEMGKKTAMRRLLKRQDLSAEVQRAVAIDEMYSAGKPITSTINMPDSFFQDEEVKEAEVEVAEEVAEEQKEKAVEQSDDKKEEQKEKVATATTILKEKVGEKKEDKKF